MYKSNQPSYLSNIVPQRNFVFNTRNVDQVPLFKIKHNVFKNNIVTEFEFCFQSLVKGISNIPKNETNKIKTKVRRTTCENSTQIPGNSMQPTITILE